MAWIKGFNFRSTSAYVTDGTNETYVVAASTYPTTRNGVTFGWVNQAGLSGFNRSSTIDHRLAGYVYDTSSATLYFRVDLPATGSYDIYLALGGYDFPGNDSGSISDTTTGVQSYSQYMSANNYIDATNVTRTSDTDWVTNQVKLTKTFATTQFRLNLDQYSPVAHLTISQVLAGGMLKMGYDGGNLTGFPPRMRLT